MGLKHIGLVVTVQNLVKDDQGKVTEIIATAVKLEATNKPNVSYHQVFLSAFISILCIYLNIRSDGVLLNSYKKGNFLLDFTIRFI